MLSRIADLITRMPWRVTLAAILFAAVAGALGGPVAASLKGGGFADPSSESSRAAADIERASGVRADGGLLAVVDTGQPVVSAATRAEVDRVAAAIARDGAVSRTLTYYGTGSPAFVSANGRETLVVGVLRSQSDEAATAAAKRVQASLAHDGQVRIGGSAAASGQVNAQVGQDLARAELLAFPILFLLSLWVFRGAVAALLPLMVGGTTIVGAFLGLRAVSSFTPLSIYALNLITGLGLGLAIDYSLFMISRYREELAAGAPPAAAIRSTLGTTGRTILFSSLTVTAAMASLLVFPERFLYSMGVGGVLVALIAASVALIVLPAVLLLLGHRVNALAPRRWQRPLQGGFEGGWYRLARGVMRRPVPVAAAAALAMVLLGLPFTGIRFTSVDASVLPASASARQVSDVVSRDFPASASSVYLVVQAPGSAASDVADLASRVAALPGVSGAGAPVPAGADRWRIDVQTRGGDLSATSQDAVRAIRGLDTRYPIMVGGSTAAFVDLEASLGQHLPLAVALVALTTLVLLFLMTGSVVLPVKALVMNLLTLSAAFGILVLVFQQGRFENLLRYTSQGALESTQPILLFALVFGLSTDYGVFLLSRIKELHDGGATNQEAVAGGLARTGRIVTAAALLFCIAIGAFATSQIVFIKELGVGTAAGVLLDATVVRAFLVSALMALLGRWNWWAPRPLRWLHSRVGLREATAPSAATP
jgi:putative drug exporter of the RND superfamily